MHESKTNIAPENRPSQKEIVFHPSIFRCYVSFREGNPFVVFLFFKSFHLSFFPHAWIGIKRSRAERTKKCNLPLGEGPTGDEKRCGNYDSQPHKVGLKNHSERDEKSTVYPFYWWPFGHLYPFIGVI